MTDDDAHARRNLEQLRQALDGDEAIPERIRERVRRRIEAAEDDGVADGV